MHTSSIPLQPINPTQSLDAYVDQYMTIVDSRYHIPSLSSTSSPTTSINHNNRLSEDSILSSDGDIENDNFNNSSSTTTPTMMRKTYYDQVTANDEDLDILHSSYKEQEDEEQERLVGSLDDLNSQEESLPDRVSPKEFGRRWLCFLFLAVLLISWLTWTIFVNNMNPGESKQTANQGHHIDLADISKAGFIPKRPNVLWIDDGQTDGSFTYTHHENHNILMRSVDDGKDQIILDSAELLLAYGSLSISQYSISKDNHYLMLWTNKTDVWRYSSVANIYVYDRENKSLFPLVNTSSIEKKPKVSYAVWSPVGHQIAYVMNNDLYVTDLHTHTRITFDGSATIFNGIPDWVYEEEIWNQNFALWWSPDATHLAYLRLDETDVPVLHLPIYTTDNDSYPDEVAMRYPKAGASNPLASLFVYSLEQETTMMVTNNSTSKLTVQAEKGHRDFDDIDRIITDVHWATDSHTHLLFKQTNRVQDKQLTNLLTITSDNRTTEHGKPRASAGTVHTYTPNDGGWIDSGKTMVFYGQSLNNDGTWRIDYIDIMADGNGYMHLVMISVGQQQETHLRWLTSGDWEVESGSVTVDRKRELVHFLSTERSPLERHLYTISLSDDDPYTTKKCLTCSDDVNIHAYYRVSFSPLAGYYVLYYDGPDIPSTVIKKISDPSFEMTLQKNDDLKKLLTKYHLPGKRMLNVKSGSSDMNVAELLPPNFDANQKYPVLFQVYGGPGSQLVTYEFQLDWHTFLASKLEYIVVTVDGRGTGFRGRNYRVGVRGRLGELETIDYTNAARHWASLDYVDQARISIWGWSYGGFLASKCIEANSGLFSAGLAVAPVTDWRFYDSIYTERYMLTPQLNPQGYVSSAVNNMTGFANSKFLLVHGTADDNVHFQNTATLVDKLTRASIHTYKVQFYTDSDHYITHNNANANLYYLLTDFLWER
ncbi:dipeptidyl peptidase IV N-terminal region-domain-containing protein [Chlamydoabsidia padenii]|nr:dipeptidyl peptidase IV N-terminal region-domain-containing protein [Chlamydoabsidia padenii]